MAHVQSILVVESDRELAATMRAYFADNGFTIRAAYSAANAFEIATRDAPDILLIDMQLPDGDGLELTRRLRNNQGTARTPIILTTNHRSTRDAVCGLEAGAQDCVAKPVALSELLARIRSLLSISWAQREREDRNTQLEHVLLQQTQRLEYLHTYVRKLCQAVNARQIYQLAVEAAQRCTGSRRVSVMIYDPQRGKLVCQCAVGMNPDIADAVQAAPGEGFAGRVFDNGTTLVAQVITPEEQQHRGYDSDDFVCTPVVSADIISGDERLGVLNVTDKPDNQPFTADEIDCLRSIADSAAIALHNETRRADHRKAVRALLLTVGRLSEYRDEETGTHLERVREYASILADALAGRPAYAAVINPAFIDDLSQAAPLHDVGKVAISDDILNKPGRLTDEEFQIMKTHTTIGRHTLMLALQEAGSIPLLQMCADIAYCHHERWNGTGYPRGLKDDQIPLSARIIALVDAYDAITSVRCYKPALPHENAVEIIRSESGKHFEPEIVEAFLAVADAFDSVRAAKADDPPVGDADFNPAPALSVPTPGN